MFAIFVHFLNFDLYPRKHDSLGQCGVNVGPVSQTMVQHWSNTGFVYRVVRDVVVKYCCINGIYISLLPCVYHVFVLNYFFVTPVFFYLQAFQPFIITKNDLQKKVLGAGYPSLPSMTVEEFYDQQVKDGVFPAPGWASVIVYTQMLHQALIHFAISCTQSCFNVGPLSLMLAQHLKRNWVPQSHPLAYHTVPK